MFKLKRLFKRVASSEKLNLIECKILYTNLHTSNTSYKIDGNVSKAKLTRLQKTHSYKISEYFVSAPYLYDMKKYIPTKYFIKRRASSVENLYLIDSEIAKSIAKRILPILRVNKSQIICETNPGLGLITTELLDNNINLVRLYETCPEFRVALKDFNDLYPGKVELFVKDIYQLSRMSHIDKLDHGNRVGQMLRNVPKHPWSSDPVMTIIGPMAKSHFIFYMMRMLSVKSEIVANGRVQLFAIMKPSHYIKLTAGPHLNLHTYQSWSVLFNLFFDYELLEKYDRNAFLPWESQETSKTSLRYSKTIDTDKMYLVRINFKKELPVRQELLSHLYYFVKQFFGRGSKKVIPTVERYIPGVGASFISPPENPNLGKSKQISIYTQFGELRPTEILNLFNIMIAHEGFMNSSFTSLVESEMLTTETVEGEEIMPLNSDVLDDLEEKIS